MQEQVYQEYAGGPTERLISNERIKDGNDILVYTNMRFLPVGVRVNARNIS